MGSDPQHRDVIVVDTDAETDDASGNGSGDRGNGTAKSFLKTAPPPAGISSIAVASEVAASHRRPQQPLWRDEYFWIYDNGKTFLRVSIRSQFTMPAPKGMGGLGPMSKQVPPSDFGESRDNPVRSLLLLRAWAWWRANLGGWAEIRGGRSNHFAEHLAFSGAGRNGVGCAVQAAGQRKGERNFHGDGS